MLLKTVFLLIILWFILVAVGNMVRAIRTDMRAARRDLPPEAPRMRKRRPQVQEDPVLTKTYGPYRNGQPTVRRRSADDIEDAKFKDLP